MTNTAANAERTTDAIRAGGGRTAAVGRHPRWLRAAIDHEMSTAQLAGLIACLASLMAAAILFG